MSYKEMITNARRNGVASEKAMLSGIDALDELLESIKDEHPDLYWQFIHDAHESLYGSHYDDQFAEADIAKIRYTDANGVEHKGAHWTKAEVKNAMGGKAFKQGVTDCDKWVAANAMYADLCKKFTDEQIIDIAYLFFFDDEDWHGNGKIWEYMELND